MKSLVSILRQKLFKAPPEAPPKVNPELTRETPLEPPPSGNQAASAAPDGSQRSTPPSSPPDAAAIAKADPQAQLTIVHFGHVCSLAVSIASSGSAYTVFPMIGCGGQNRHIAAIAPDVAGLRRICFALQAAGLVLEIAPASPDVQSGQCQSDLFFELLDRVRGNRAAYIPMQFSEAHRLLMLAVESVSAATAAKGGE